MTLDKYLKKKRPASEVSEEEEKVEITNEEEEEEKKPKAKKRRVIKIKKGESTESTENAEESKESKKSETTDNKKSESKGEEAKAEASASSSASAETWQPPAEVNFDALEDAIEPSWRKALAAEFKKPYWKKLKEFVKSEYEANKGTIFPPINDVFSAFNHCTYDNVKVIVLGQDPYHGKGQAHGLAFSVRKGVTVPPSLKNIYKELATDISGFKTPKHGCLTEWSDQGVLLLNTVLTVRQANANSHAKHGWEEFTDAVITKLNKEKKNLVFLLWGAPAQKKAKQVSETTHCVLKAPHPSPLSASKGWFGSKTFSKCNAYLKKNGKPEINWQITDS